MNFRVVSLVPSLPALLQVLNLLGKEITLPCELTMYLPSNFGMSFQTSSLFIKTNVRPNYKGSPLVENPQLAM